MAASYLLDSDICIFVMKRRPPALLRRLEQRASRSAISVIAYGELAFGEVASTRRDEAAAHLAARTRLAARELVALSGSASRRRHPSSRMILPTST